MAAPRPGPEHEVLKGELGTWDATVEFFATPGGAPMVSKGTETNTLGQGGFWVLTDFKGDMMGQGFTGHGSTGYDPAKQKYWTTWIDSTSPGLSVGEMKYDAATKTFTGWSEGVGPDGKPQKMKTTTQQPDPNTRIFSMFATGADGKDQLTLKITYKRRP
jgi:hypothetical protein